MVPQGIAFGGFSRPWVPATGYRWPRGMSLQWRLRETLPAGAPRFGGPAMDCGEDLVERCHGERL
jgi:hypothetical protein